MFVDAAAVQLPSVHFPSTWQQRSAHPTATSLSNFASPQSTQTQSIAHVEQATQSTVRLDAEMQTIPTVSGATSATTTSSMDPITLQRFLTLAEPILSEQLLRNAKSEYELLQDYEPAQPPSLEGPAADQGGSASITMEVVASSLRHPNAIPDLPIRCMDWNAKGTTLAVGYGHTTHRGWCSHRGQVALWNLQRPHIVMETESCVTAVAFHPRHLGQVLVGTYSGEVLVLDSRRAEMNKDPVVASSRNATGTNSARRLPVNPNHMHFEPVPKVLWIDGETDGSGSTSLVMSFGMDGKILVWTVDEKNKALVPTCGVSLSQSDLQPSAPSSLSVPILCAAAVQVRQLVGMEYFVVLGTEHGRVCMAPLSSLPPLDANSAKLGSVAWKVLASLHAGPVTSLSVLNDAQLVSSGSDGKLKLRTFSEPNSRVLAEWIPGNQEGSPMASATASHLIACTPAGTVFVYDPSAPGRQRYAPKLVHQQLLESLSLHVRQACATHRHRYLALALSDGTLTLLQLLAGK